MIEIRLREEEYKDIENNRLRWWFIVIMIKLLFVLITKVVIQFKLIKYV